MNVIKNRLFIILIFIPVAIYGQDKKDTTDVRELRGAQMKMMSQNIAYHEHLTIFCGDLGFNTSHQSLISFLDKHMDMTEKSQDYENGHIVSIVSEKMSFGKPLKMKIDYTVADPIDDSGEFSIKKVKITGSFNHIVTLFIKYWGTEIQSKNLKKNEWVYNYQAPDRIGLFLTHKGDAYIEITHM